MAEGYYYLGRILHAEGKSKAAELSLQKSLALFPDSEEARRELHKVQLKLKSKEDLRFYQ